MDASDRECLSGHTRCTRSFTLEFFGFLGMKMVGAGLQQVSAWNFRWIPGDSSGLHEGIGDAHYGRRCTQGVERKESP